jgi:hypothetical protein
MSRAVFCKLIYGNISCPENEIYELEPPLQLAAGAIENSIGNFRMICNPIEHAMSKVRSRIISMQTLFGQASGTGKNRDAEQSRKIMEVINCRSMASPAGSMLTYSRCSA